MDTGLVLKPAASAPQVGDARSGLARTAVATDLALSQAVTAATAAASAPYAGSSRVPALVIDPRGREVLYRLADLRARRATREAPDSALLRQRAYTRAGHDGEDDESTLEVTA